MCLPLGRGGPGADDGDPAVRDSGEGHRAAGPEAQWRGDVDALRVGDQPQRRQRRAGPLRVDWCDRAGADLGGAGEIGLRTLPGISVVQWLWRCG